MSRNMTISDFYCTKCGRKGIPIARKQGQQREPGHLKKLYCLACGEETNHAEVRGVGSAYTKEDFMLEFALGRFVDGKKIPIAELMSCSEKNNWRTDMSFETVRPTDLSEWSIIRQCL